jgi:hypothetical protein
MVSDELSTSPEAGRMAGFALKEKEENQIRKVHSYEEVLLCFKELAPGIINLNKRTLYCFTK